MARVDLQLIDLLLGTILQRPLSQRLRQAPRAARRHLPRGRPPAFLPGLPRVRCPVPRWTSPAAIVGFSAGARRPSLSCNRVGFLDFTFEACPGFPRVTTRESAHLARCGASFPEASVRRLASTIRSGSCHVEPTITWSELPSAGPAQLRGELRHTGTARPSELHCR